MHGCMHEEGLTKHSDSAAAWKALTSHYELALQKGSWCEPVMICTDSEGFNCGGHTCACGCCDEAMALIHAKNVIVFKGRAETLGDE